jgi:hypothetical protein
LPVELPVPVERTLRQFRVDFEPEHEQPAIGLVLLATAAALAGSLLADAILVKIGEAVFPATKGYVHFRFSDYAKLTIIGVIIACVAWPIVTRMSSDPRWLFFRQAIAVTLVLFLPDLYLLYRGQPGDAVAVLMLMHLAIALVTYNALVHIARVRPAVTSRRHGAHAGGRARGRETGYGDYDRGDYGRGDYGRGAYGQQDYDRGDYDRGDYDRGGYGQQDYYGQQGYGHQDYGQGNYGYGEGGGDSFPADRYPEPARRYPGYRDPADPYQVPSREPDDPYRAHHREPDDPYEAYYRKPADPYEDRLR